MPDTKISAMPSATTFVAADVIPIVQSGVNKKCDRDIFLSAQPTEQIVLRGANSEILIDGSSGSCTILLGIGSNLGVTDGVTYFFETVSGGVAINATTGHTIVISGTGASITIDGFGAIQIVAAGGQVLHLMYTPGVSGDWVGPAPTDVWTALDRIAANIVVITGNPIP